MTAITSGADALIVMLELVRSAINSFLSLGTVFRRATVSRGFRERIRYHSRT
jgi:hypothetical protein